MRLLPPGNSDPEPSHVSEHEKSTLKTLAIISGLGLLVVPGHKRVTTLKKCLTYGTAVAVPLALHNRYVEQRVAAYGLRSENTVGPKTVYVDRLSNFDIDNAVLLGGLTGAYIASRLRRPGSTTGLRRHVAAMSVGAGTPMIAFWAYGMIKNWQNEPAKSSEPLKLEMEPLSSTLDITSPFEILRTTLESTMLKDVPLVAEGTQRVPGNDGSSMAMLGLGGPMDDSSGSGGEWGSSHSGPPGAPVKLEILTNGPHVAVKQGDEEPQFIPQRNYTWYSENKIAELEQHVATMREKRREVASEAEFVGTWLSEKEAEHYEKFPVTKKWEKDDVPDRATQESSFLVQTLNQIHAGLWREAQTMDWIITDTEKQIAQERSRTAAGKIEWRATCSETASASPLKIVMETLKKNAESQAAMRDQLEQAQSSLAMSLGDPSADMNQMAMHPIKHVWASQKEIVKDIRKHYDEQTKSIKLLEETLKKAMVEAEQRAGKSN